MTAVRTDISIPDRIGNGIVAGFIATLVMSALHEPVTLITAASGLFIIFLVACLYKWLQDDRYGINDNGSLIFMGALYVLAIAIFVGSRLYRRSQGMDLSMAYGEIPAE